MKFVPKKINKQFDIKRIKREEEISPICTIKIKDFSFADPVFELQKNFSKENPTRQEKE